MTSMKDISEAIDKASRKIAKKNKWPIGQTRGVVKDLVLSMVPGTYEILTDKDVVNACCDGTCEL